MLIGISTYILLSYLKICISSEELLRSFSFSHVFTSFGKNLGDRVQNRIQAHLRSINGLIVHPISSISIHNWDSNCIILSIGNTSIQNNLYNLKDLILPHESFKITVSRDHEYNSFCKYIIFADGMPLNPDNHRNVSFNKNRVHYGAVVSAYATLELLGFAFLHPLHPYIPPYLRLKDCPYNDTLQSNDCSREIIESPHWPERSFHIHTQHPVELTEVLQGHDIPQFGPIGSHCSKYTKRYPEYDNIIHRYSKKSRFMDEHANVTSPSLDFTYCERWEDMVNDVNKLYEWAVANRLNKLEWLLLGNYKWGDELETRMKRFKLLTALAHDYSLYVGADCPIGNHQQHAWYMVNTRLSLAAQYQQIRERVDWIFNAGFDFLTTENGLSEFTNPGCSLMLNLLNEFAEYVNGTWGREAAIKVHCSTGQSCDEFLDPNTGEPVNFNFLTMFATSKLGVFPHTVQVYAFDDPTAGAYGNENFTYIEDYLVYEAKAGNRSVVYYGETAYWVNVDIDVPLFLPIYGQRRLLDLRKIATREIKENFKIQGQMNFDSGWEWGYWLSDVITARASWNPVLIASEDVIKSDLGYSVRQDEWDAYRIALSPITNIFGDVNSDKVKDIIIALSKAQVDLLLLGKVQGKECPNLKKLSGFPYLSGDDTWIDLPRMFGLPLLQPDKVHIREFKDPNWPHAIALLREMDAVFTALADEMSDLVLEVEDYRMNSTVSTAGTCTGMVSSLVKTCTGDSTASVVHDDKLVSIEALNYLHELDDCMRVLALRAQQVRMLYESHDPNITETAAERASLLKQSRSIIAAASTIVTRREKAYRVPWQRVASWRENPTVYRYGYLWSVHSLYYWWRDQGRAEGASQQSELSPCYLNRMDASEVAIGWGKYSLEVLRNVINRYSPFSTGYPLELVNCFAPPSKEYEFPRDLYPL